jgi:hypothetical protein
MIPLAKIETFVRELMELDAVAKRRGSLHYFSD